MSSRASIFFGAGIFAIAILMISALPDGPWRIAGSISVSALSLALVYVLHGYLASGERQVERYRYELAIARERLEKLQYEYERDLEIDHLTKCFNAGYFEKEAQRFIALNRRSSVDFSLVVLKIDFFSEVLAAEGQQGGNELLKIVANLLCRGVRETDVVARTGEDTFSLLLSDAIGDDVVLVAERLMSLARQIRHKGVREGTVTVSMGVTSYRDQGDLETLFAEAGEAIDVAIAEGGDRIAVFAEPETVAA